MKDEMTDTEKIDSKILAVFERISRMLRVVRQDLASSVGCSPLQLEIMRFIGSHSDKLSKTKIIAEEFGLATPTVSDALSTLEKKGFVERSKNPEDRRSFIFNLSGKGTEVLNRTKEFDIRLSKGLEGFGTENKEEILLFLIRYILKLQDEGIVEPTRICPLCKHFIKRKEEGAEEEDTGIYYCNLTEREITMKDIRFHCDDHERKEGVTTGALL